MIGGIGPSEIFVMIFFSFIVPLALLLIFREVVCWYWKINQMVKTLDSINTHLEKIAAGGSTPPVKNNS